MKLIIQIPCYNEESTIAETLQSLPERIEGIDAIDVLVIDDGSTDGTVETVARYGRGNCSVIRLGRHRGLADAFYAGVRAALERGADILVNTDADMQYPSQYIESLVKPIIRGAADIAVGDRLSGRPRAFPPIKQMLEKLGSRAVSSFAGVRIRDAASGFRAFSREVLEALFIRGRFSYTLESLVFAGMRKFRIANVPIRINPPRRRSRLFKTTSGYLFRSLISLIRAYLMYHPLSFFAGIGLVLCGAGIALGLRFIWFYLRGGGGGHIQSLILAAILLLMGFQCAIVGFVADIVSANRRLIEEVRIKQIRDHPPRFPGRTAST